MRIAVTGASGFIGRYIVRHLARPGHECRCWFRPESDRSGFDDVAPTRLAWLSAELGDSQSTTELVLGCDAVVHAALYHPGGGFRSGEGEILEFAERNVLGTLRLIEAARAAGVPRFVFTTANGTRWSRPSRAART
jgi:nucleoside-diphosphate-sugar epimerase